MPEDQLRDVDVMLLMNFNRNALSIVLYTDETLFFVYLDFELVHLPVSLIVVRSVH